MSVIEELWDGKLYYEKLGFIKHDVTKLRHKGKDTFFSYFKNAMIYKK